MSKVGELFSSLGPQFIPGPPFISWARFNSGLLNYQWQTKCIKHNFMLFFFVKFCKNIQHCEFMILKMWTLNELLTMGLLQRTLLTCWGQERGFQLTLTHGCTLDMASRLGKGLFGSWSTGLEHPASQHQAHWFMHHLQKNPGHTFLNSATRSLHIFIVLLHLLLYFCTAPWAPVRGAI